MNFIKKLLAIVVGLLLAVVLGITGYFSWLPKSAPPSAEVVAATPERLARGKYLFDAVLGCPVCHSERNFAEFGAPPVPPFGGGRACAEPGKPLPGLAAGSGLPAVIVGNDAQARDGQYVRLRDEAGSVLIDRSLDLPGETNGWLDRNVIEYLESLAARAYVCVYTTKQGGLATLAAFCRATRSTFTGSMMPALTRSQTLPRMASKPSLPSRSSISATIAGPS